jgi:hypothetical protein
MSPNPLGILGAAGSIVGGVMGQNAQQWQQGALMSVLNQLMSSNSFGTTYGQNQFNPASAAAQGLLDRAPQLLFGNTDGSTPGDFTNLSNYIGSAAQGFSPGVSTAGMNSSLNSLNTAAGGLNPTMNLLQQVIAGGGASAQSANIYNLLGGLANGTSGNMGALGTAGSNLLSGGGASAMTPAAMQAAISSIQNGGMTSGLTSAQNALNYIVSQGGSNSNINAGVNSALGLLPGSSQYITGLANAGNGGLASNLGTAGLTATGAQGETAALGGIQNQGMTGDAQFLQNQGQALDQAAVLPTLLATSLAQNQATSQFENAGQQARAQALARGGGPGDVVANGAANQGLADFATQGAQGISGAISNALQQQQALGLQQQQNGASQAASGGNLQLGNLNNYSSLLQGLESVATNRYAAGGGMLNNAQSQSTGMTQTGLQGLNSLSSLQSQNLLQSLGLMPTVANSAANQANTFGNLGLGVGGQNLSAIGLGGTLSSTQLQAMLSALSGQQAGVTQANNYTLGAGGALNGMTGTQGNLYNQLFGNNSTALQNLIGNQGNMTNQEMGMYGQGLSNLNTIGTAGFNYAQSANNGMANLFGNYQPNNPLGAGIANGMGILGGV